MDEKAKRAVSYDGMGSVTSLSNYREAEAVNILFRCGKKWLLMKMLFL